MLVTETDQWLEPIEGAADLRHVHHAPGDHVAARRGPERCEVSAKDLGARLGRVVRLRLLDRNEPAVRTRAPERRLVVVPVCGARTLAEGRPPLGIACAQQDVARVYPLPDDPERCLDDFLTHAADHAQRLAETLEHREASVERFLEINTDE